MTTGSGRRLSFNLRSNATWALLEVLLSALAVFAVYRAVIVALGIEAVGIWALVAATLALSRFADIGAAAGLTRYVAVSLESDRHHGAATYIATAALANFALYALATAVLYVPGQLLLTRGLGPQDAALALELYPSAALAVPLAVLASTLLSGLMGLHNAKLKSQYACCGQLAYVAVVAATVGDMSLVAIGIGQVVQAGVVIGLASVSVARRTRPAGAVGLWSTSALRQMLAHGLRVQAAGVAGLVFDPASKYLMSVYGGVEALGLFDMAQRFVLQVRQLVNGPLQVLVPAFAGVSERSSAELRELFVRSYCLSVLIGVPTMALAVLVSPVVAYLWLGMVSAAFCIFVGVLAVAWTVSLISAPGYLLATGVGTLRWNILGNLAVTALTLVLASLLGAAWGGFGVALGSALSLMLGNVIMILGNARSVAAPVIPGRTDFTLAIRQALP